MLTNLHIQLALEQHGGELQGPLKQRFLFHATVGHHNWLHLYTWNRREGGMCIQRNHTYRGLTLNYSGFSPTPHTVAGQLSPHLILPKCLHQKNN